MQPIVFSFFLIASLIALRPLYLGSREGCEFINILFLLRTDFGILKGKPLEKIKLYLQFFIILNI